MYYGEKSPYDKIVVNLDKCSSKIDPAVISVVTQFEFPGPRFEPWAGRRSLRFFQLRHYCDICLCLK
jgi:hypothetical protein